MRSRWARDVTVPVQRSTGTTVADCCFCSTAVASGSLADGEKGAMLFNAGETTMPLVMQERNGRSNSVVVCDYCDQRITDARDGNYHWRMGPNDTDFGHRISFTQQHCCQPFEDSHDGDGRTSQRRHPRVHRVAPRRRPIAHPSRSAWSPNGSQVACLPLGKMAEYAWAAVQLTRKSSGLADGWGRRQRGPPLFAFRHLQLFLLPRTSSLGRLAPAARLLQPVALPRRSQHVTAVCQ